MSTPKRLGRSEVSRLLEEAGVRPSRALGQNFVIDPNVTERIARLAAIGAGDQVLEVGAGLGSLTLALAASGATVTAVEIDHRLAEVLARVVPPSVRVVEADALNLDVASLYASDQPLQPGSVTLVANLPYNVATPLVLSFLEGAPLIGRYVVMVQREVGERLAAPPGSRTYGAVSARVAYFADAAVVGLVSPSVFHPKPNVTSCLVELRRREQVAVAPELASYAEISSLVRQGFSGRRKMLRRSLAGAVDEEIFALSGVDPMARAEQLGIVEWGKLAACRRSVTSSRAPS